MTKTHPAPATTAKRHYGLVRSLRTLGFSEIASRVAACGRIVVYECNECTGRAGRVNYHCKHPLCPFCQSMLASRRAHARERMVHDLDNPTLLTLSIPGYAALSESVAIINNAWKVLSKNKEWRALFPTAFVYLETSYNHQASLWQRHLHLIADAAQPLAATPNGANDELLGPLWEQATGIKGARAHCKPLEWDEMKGLYDALRYPQKPPNIQHRADLVQEWIEQLKGKKTTWAYGSLRNHPATEDKDTTEDTTAEDKQYSNGTTCPHCGTIDGMNVVRKRKGARKEWARYRCTPVGSGWYHGPAPPKPIRGSNNSTRPV